MSEAAAAVVVPEPEKQPSVWTKEMQAALKAADRVVFRFEPRPEGAPSWEPNPLLVEFVREERKEEGRPYQPEQRLEFALDGFIRAGYSDEVNVSTSYGYESFSYSNRSYKPARGVWSVRLYHGDPSPEETALTLLPVGAQVKFEVGLDYHSNGYMAKASLHGDVLLVSFKKGKQRGVLEIDNTIVPMNTARFGFGG